MVTLENQLKQFQLEQARATSPWELISTPTLLDNPVSPRKGRTLALGLLAGLVLGSGGALISDRRSGRVFSSDELSRELPAPLLERLPCDGDERPIEAWRAPIQLLADGPLADDGSVALIPVGSIEPADLDAFSASLRQASGPQRELLISHDLLATRACSTQLLLAAPVPPSGNSCANCGSSSPFREHPWPVGCCSTPASRPEQAMARLLVTGGAGFIGSHMLCY